MVSASSQFDTRQFRGAEEFVEFEPLPEASEDSISFPHFSSSMTEDDVVMGTWDSETPMNYYHAEEYMETGNEVTEGPRSVVTFHRRMLKKGECPLLWFRNKKGMAPKHEYFMAMLIRAMKKGIRSFSTGRDYPSGGVFTVMKNNKRAEAKWAEFHRELGPYRDLLLPASRTEAGPATDGKTKRNPETAIFSSFNKAYIQHFYDNAWIRIAHYYFTEAIFEASPKTLSAAMKISCCAGDHSGKCERLWAHLKHYAQTKVIEEVGLLPFTK